MPRRDSSARLLRSRQILETYTTLKLMDLAARIKTTAFAFRGYNVTNQGRTLELLNHPAYGSVMLTHLAEASEVCSDELGEKVDLESYVREQRPSSLDTFAEDMALISIVEVAQIRLLEQFFGIQWQNANCAFGYSLGEVAALIAAGVYEFKDLAPLPMGLARECAELGRRVTMGIIFSRSPALDLDQVHRLCLDINAEGNGVIGVSAILSPNSVLVLGEQDTVDRAKARLADYLPKPVHLRKNPNHWPPLHTPLLWQNGLPGRVAHQLHTVPGGRTTPKPKLISCVTGKADYNDVNNRDILIDWVDHPQRLWDVVVGVLSAGTEVIVHVGPEPNLIPATFKRLSDNVSDQLKRRSLNSIGLRAMSGIARRAWLRGLLSKRSSLLRAPFVQHVILEDWLLEQEVN